MEKNNPVDISLAEGGSTGVKNLTKERITKSSIRS